MKINILYRFRDPHIDMHSKKWPLELSIATENISKGSQKIFNAGFYSKMKSYCLLISNNANYM